ncbi:YgfZ/GcvT domain-containing protein [Compostimonas suwonensis]|uniref:Uncharacterized protein n=1 Tax=Compostimonas suwonensis TaxID=1048394 RepID=A0A2M9BVG3_9MICO|nr:folate-binding protein YgfZ [Compostimonas suwonensis]PJJ61941.1 hypothetical protein CLV54_1730 [Compostimonas suwonensis]
MSDSPFLSLPGAVADEGLDAGVAAHYGSPLREQRLLAAGEAVVDLSNRSVLAVTGADRLSWLDSMTSQRLTGLAPGQAAETLFLDPSGRIEFDVHALDDGVTTWLIAERDEAEGIVGWLDKMRFMLRVEVADRSDEFAVVGYLDAAIEAPARTVVQAASPDGVELRWADVWRGVEAGGHQYAHTDDHPASRWPWVEAIVERSELEALARRAAAGEVVLAGSLAAEALRIEAWRPRFGREVDDRSIPHELDWLRSAVHLTKGCYRGQETVAKVHNLGHPPRRLVLLHLDGSESVFAAPGDVVSVERDGELRAVGTVTSSAIHHELGPIALAVVKRNTDAEATLLVAAQDTTIAASQEVIVPSDAGAAVDVPRLPRLGAVTRG